LDKYRKEIDRIDEKLVSLLSRRQDLAADIGGLKRSLGAEILDPGREQEVLKHLSSKGQGNLGAKAIRTIFSEIICAARSVQETLAVAYLGPETTFSHQAAISLFGHLVPFRATESIEEVFGLVEKGVCQQGVVPIENSYEGSVNRTLDLLYQYEMKITAEIFLRVRHHLMSRADDKKKIERIFSHPMPIWQCKTWIKTHMAGVPIVEVASTALAAKMAADEPNAAAVGSRLSGDTYGLNMLEENIEDHPDNITRFLVIGKSDSKPTGRDKTSLLFFLQHRPGALYEALGSLAERNINMSRIESRPMKTRNWEYLFFVDLEGHEQDSNVREALKKLEEHCVFMRRLGSYPAGGEAWD
jgi:chorismate mutase/prephenate dehydratase